MIDLESAMLQQLWHRFKNFAPPGLIFSPDKDVMPGGFDEDQMLDIYQWVATQHALASKSYRPMVMPSGVKVDNVSPTPKEMDYDTSLEKALEYILAIFSTPKAAVGMVADFNKNNYQAAMSAWGDNMLNPLLTHMGQHLTQDLAHEYDERLVVRFPKIDAKDLMVISKFIEMMLRFGVTELDEVRAVATELGVAKLPPTGRKLVPQQRSEEQANPQVEQQPEGVQKSHESNGNGKPVNRMFPQNDREIALLGKRIGDIQSNMDTVCDRMMTAVRETVQGNLTHVTEQQSARLEHVMDVVKRSLEEVADKASTDLSGVKDLIVRSGTEHGLATQVAKSLEGIAEVFKEGIVEAAKSIDLPATEVHNEIEIPELDVSFLKAEAPQVTVNVEPTPVNITNEVDVPETNVTVKGIAGPKGKDGAPGKQGAKGAKGDKGTASDVNVTVEQSKPKTAKIKHSDGSKSTVELS